MTHKILATPLPLDVKQAQREIQRLRAEVELLQTEIQILLLEGKPEMLRAVKTAHQASERENALLKNEVTLLTSQRRRLTTLRQRSQEEVGVEHSIAGNAMDSLAKQEALTRTLQENINHACHLLQPMVAPLKASRHHQGFAPAIEMTLAILRGENPRNLSQSLPNLAAAGHEED